MSSKPELLVAPCSYQAAKYAVEKWHYSGRMPKSKQAFIGVWEGGLFIGAVIMGLSVTPYLGDKFNLSAQECAELTRVALREHAAPVSQIVSRAVRIIKGQSPGLRLLVSYADPFAGHNGAIYQAMNWVYVGQSSMVRQYFWRGSWRNDSPMFREFARTPQLRQETKHRDLPPKHKYLYPLDKAMRKQIAPLAQPYPKRAAEVTPSDTPGDQPGEGGARPTQPLEILE